MSKLKLESHEHMLEKKQTGGGKPRQDLVVLIKR